MKQTDRRITSVARTSNMRERTEPNVRITVDSHTTQNKLFTNYRRRGVESTITITTKHYRGNKSLLQGHCAVLGILLLKHSHSQ